MTLENTKKWTNIPNPYRPHDLETGEWFYHEGIVNKIKEIFFSQPKNRLIFLEGNPGSGKTSTLRKIFRSPDLLGEQFLPIYIDGREYKGKKRISLLRSVYQDVKRSLKYFDIEMPDLVIEYESTIETIILFLESTLPGNKITFFIFDEFEFFLSGSGIELIREFVENIDSIEKHWDNFAVILAGDKRTVKLNRESVVRRLLDVPNKIDADEMAENTSLIEFIVKPVKDLVQYTNDAIEAISVLSGNNLYFQQLICSYLIELCNRERKNSCSKDDVESVISKILTDPRPEFEHGWEIKSSIDDRLIASALADECITKKRGSYYYPDFSEDSLIWHLFGKEIFNKLADLEDFGYLSKYVGKRFNTNPFKIPLYGMWIQREHPFLKTLFSQIKERAPHLSMRLLIEAIREHREEKLAPFHKETILKIACKWHELEEAIVQMQESNITQRVESFFKEFSEMLKLQMLNNAQPGGFSLDIKKLNIGIKEYTLCLFQDTSDITKEDIFRLENFATSVAKNSLTGMVLFFHFHPSDFVDALAANRHLNLIGIDENDLKYIIFFSRPAERFRQVILERLSLENISTYQIAGAAKVTFYGRKQIIERITSVKEQSFVLVGARRIGKTSLLYKIEEEPPPGITYVMLNLEPYFHPDSKSYKRFFKALQEELAEVFKTDVKLGCGLFGPKLIRFKENIRDLSMLGRKIVFIFDEIDDFLVVDKKHNFKMLKLFRTMSQDKICQFIFAGFKELYRCTHEHKNPLYNFCEEIVFTPLEQSAALALMTKPMESIGVRYDNKNDRELILEYTAAHPNLVQFFCTHLITLIQAHENGKDKRTIYREDIENVFNDEYVRYILNDVYMFFDDLENLQKLILLLCMENYSKDDWFSAKNIKTLLNRHGIDIFIDDIRRTLRNMVMRFILKMEKVDSFSFALPHFPRILREYVGTDYKDELIEELTRNGKKSV